MKFMDGEKYTNKKISEHNKKRKSQTKRKWKNQQKWLREPHKKDTNWTFLVRLSFYGKTSLLMNSILSSE